MLRFAAQENESISLRKMSATRVVVVLLACVAAGAFAFVDECSQFQTCEQCLNVSNSGSGARQNCGWCHIAIIYEDGTQGARCADIRDKPWKVCLWCE